MTPRGSTLIALAVLTGCHADITPPGPPPAPSIDAQLRANIGPWGVVPIGPMPALNQAQVELGRALFFDKILSGNRDVACATCHSAAAALGDGRSHAIGTGGIGDGTGRTLGPGREFTLRGAPSLLNSGLGLFNLFWDARLSGRAGSFTVDSGVTLPPGLPDALTAQAMLPVLNRREMRGDVGDRDVFGSPNELARFADGQNTNVWDAVMARILAVSDYVSKFTAAFPGVPNPKFEHAARALAAFQMQAFTTTQSPFDRYLDRDDAALTLEQKRGGLLFFGKARCSQCHNGPFLGAQSFANVGAPQVGPGGRREAGLDLGRGEQDSNQFYRFAFRVAPLRNVELTAPYFHSGAYATLEAVVKHYNNVPVAIRQYDPSQLAPDVRPLHRGDAATVDAVLATLDGRLQQPLELTAPEMVELVAFLKALTDPAARNLAGLK